MNLTSLEEVCRAFLKATSSEQVHGILAELGDHSWIGLAQQFGDFGFAWRAYGDRSTNVSTIGLATKPGRSLAERITNATEAVLEERVIPSIQTPSSVRAAAFQWFGRPETSPENGLFAWNYEQGAERRITVLLQESGTSSAPTVDVVDDGIGILPDHFPSTILSLQAENKIKKKYLIGAFGQGGSSTLAFCDYALIVSWSKDQPNTVGFTIVRVLKLDESYKEDCFAYLVLKDATSGRTIVPSFRVNESDFMLYPERERVRLPSLKRGTLVRHFSYKLDGLERQLSPGPGNLYHYLQCIVFDALLPFHVTDLRRPGKESDQVIKGSRNRLMRLASRRRRRPKAAAAIGDLSWACRHRLHPTLPNNDRGTTE